MPPPAALPLVPAWRLPLREELRSPRQRILPRSERIVSCFFKRMSVRSASSTTAFFVGSAVNFCASLIKSSSRAMLVLNGFTSMCMLSPNYVYDRSLS